MKKFLLGIANVQIYSQDYKLIKKNKPTPTQVSKSEYWDFLFKYDDFISRSETNTVAENTFVYDDYNNVVAGVSFSSDEVKYYINEEMLLKGLEFKTEIKDEKEFIGSSLVHEFKCDPQNIEINGGKIEGGVGITNVNFNRLEQPETIKRWLKNGKMD